MSDLNSSNHMSLLTLILPRESVSEVSSAIEKIGANGIVQINARGSVLNEGGGILNKMFPPPAPEQQILQVLVNNSHVGGGSAVIAKIDCCQILGFIVVSLRFSLNKSL